jgi:adenosylcobinamide-phosphate synthase
VAELVALQAASLVLALILDRLIGYPDRLYRLIGHPVTWIGALIALLDRRWNQDGDTPRRRRLMGIVALVVIVAASAGAGVGLVALAHALLPPWVAAAVLAIPLAMLTAVKSLDDHVAAVGSALDDGGAPAGRIAVSHIVGRDVSVLDEAGVCRAAVESLAENASDGVVAPAGWALLLGLPGIAVYKAVNTADSMIGHRSERHLMFGWASARFDDLLNLPWSRLTALLVASAAALTPGGRAWASLQAAFRDASRHQSPNAGWPEAAFAGALGLSLGGPRAYGGEILDLPAMGDGRRDLARADIAAALALYRRLFTLIVALAALVGVCASLIRP